LKLVIVFDKRKFKSLTPALQRQLIRKAIDELLGTLKDIETRHIEEVLIALDKPAGRRIMLPEGLIFSIEYDSYLLGFHPEALVPYPELTGNYEIKVPGITQIPGWQIDASVHHFPLNPSQTSPFKKGGKLEFSECFDFGKTGSKIGIRAREPGDWFQPLGMDQPEKVGRFMLDARIPHSWRDKIPVFYSQEQIIWIAGWRFDDRVKVSEDTRELLCLRMVRKDESGGKNREDC
jgi:tRNA(Ile)-lysidine synthase